RRLEEEASGEPASPALRAPSALAPASPYLLHPCSRLPLNGRGSSAGRWRPFFLLANTFDRDDQLDGFRGRAEVHLDVEILQGQGGGPFETGTVAAPRVLALANELGGDDHRLGHTVEGQIAGDIGGAFASGLDRSGLEGRGIVLAGVEEVGAANVLVALGMVGVDAGGLQSHADLARLGVGGVEAEFAVEVLEGAVQPAVAQVADLEIDEGVLALLVDDVVGRHGLATDQSGAQNQCSEGFLQHGVFSLRGCRSSWALARLWMLQRPNIRSRVLSRSMKWCFRAASPCRMAKI